MQLTVCDRCEKEIWRESKAFETLKIKPFIFTPTNIPQWKYPNLVLCDKCKKDFEKFMKVNIK